MFVQLLVPPADPPDLLEVLGVLAREAQGGPPARWQPPCPPHLAMAHPDSLPYSSSSSSSPLDHPSQPLSRSHLLRPQVNHLHTYAHSSRQEYMHLVRMPFQIEFNNLVKCVFTIMNTNILIKNCSFSHKPFFFCYFLNLLLNLQF